MSRSADGAAATLPEQIEDILAQSMLSGTLRPGERIVESRIARQLGVSQSSVREALHRLEGQGLVCRFPNRGVVVTDLRPEDVERIYRLRGMLEGLAAEMAAERITRAEAREMQGIVDRMIEAAEAADLVRFIELDWSFHRMLWRITGDPHLERALIAVSRPHFGYSTIRALFPSRQEIVTLASPHGDLLRTIESGDARAAGRHMRKATAEACRIVLRKMRAAAAAQFGPHLLKRGGGRNRAPRGVA